MKVNHSMTSLIAAGLMVLFATNVEAQRPGGGQGGGGFRGGQGQQGGGFRGGPGGSFGFRGGAGGGGSSMGLLRIEAVQTELEISPAQKEALDKLAEQGRGERPDFGNFREMSEEERREAFEKMRTQAEERAKEMMGQLEEVLLPQQLERLQQISLQIRGVQALEDPEVAKKLGITEEQKTKLAEARQAQGEKMREKMREMFQGGGGPQGDLRESMMKMREEMEKDILSVLTTSQQEKFEEMKGEKFEMPQMMGRGGRGGFGQGGQRGQGGPGGQRGPGGAQGGRRGGDRPQSDF